MRYESKAYLYWQTILYYYNDYNYYVSLQQKVMWALEGVWGGGRKEYRGWDFFVASDIVVAHIFSTLKKKNTFSLY